MVGCSKQHPRFRLAASTAVRGEVGTKLPDVEGAKNFGDSLVHGLYLRFSNQATADAGLITDYPNWNAVGTEYVQSLARAGHGTNECGVTVIGNVDDEGIIAVE